MEWFDHCLIQLLCSFKYYCKQYRTRTYATVSQKGSGWLEPPNVSMPAPHENLNLPQGRPRRCPSKGVAGPRGRDFSRAPPDRRPGQRTTSAGSLRATEVNPRAARAAAAPRACLRLPLPSLAQPGAAAHLTSLLHPAEAFPFPAHHCLTPSSCLTYLSSLSPGRP